MPLLERSKSIKEMKPLGDESSLTAQESNPSIQNMSQQTRLLPETTIFRPLPITVPSIANGCCVVQGQG
jgi:hypothetical protein